MVSVVVAGFAEAEEKMRGTLQVVVSGPISLGGKVGVGMGNQVIFESCGGRFWASVGSINRSRAHLGAKNRTRAQGNEAFTGDIGQQ